MLVLTIGLVLQNSHSLATTVQHSSKDLLCLAKNIYYEARGEPTKGKLAVAQVTLNRVSNPKYQNTICSVVYAKNQFSWTKDTDRKAPSGQAWQDALVMAQRVLSQGVAIPKFTALYFHAHYILPSWATRKQKLARIGNHIFYS